MEPAALLSTVTPLPPSPARPGGRLLVASLLLNGGLMLAGAAAGLWLQAQLENLNQRTQLHTTATVRSARELVALGDQSRALGEGLVAFRKVVADRAHEERLFLKVLILKPGIDHALARRIAASVHRECARQGQDPNLVLSIMAVESGFNPRAVSSAGAVGLMQVMPLWKQELGVQELSEPETSIRAGIQILGRYQQMYRNLALTVTAYNVGPGTVNEALGSGASPFNGYSDKVLGLWRRLEAIDVSARQEPLEQG